jgi:hypothetical protein
MAKQAKAIRTLQRLIAAADSDSNRPKQERIKQALQAGINALESGGKEPEALAAIENFYLELEASKV